MDNSNERGKQMDRRTYNTEVFRDTAGMVYRNKALKAFIKDSIANQKLYLQNENHEFTTGNRKDTAAKILVSKKRSYEAAEPYARAGKKVCVLNFASARCPGGGVKHGASAQEECLCRCSTLYWCLSDHTLEEKFYRPHKQLDTSLYNDDCIYTPDVYVIKTDVDFPEAMDPKDWYKVDVLTCAAPNLRHIDLRYSDDNIDEASEITKDDLRALFTSRIRRIFQVAAENEAEVLILGAFGCGAFRNPPEIVASVFEELSAEYQYYFETIEYAVFCRDYETENYKIFQAHLEK